MKSFRKTLKPVTKPFSYVHKTFLGLGFTSTEDKLKPLYHIVFRCPETARNYTLYVSAQTHEDGQAEVMLPGARFEDEDQVPETVKEAARSKLKDVSDYLEQLNNRPLNKVDEVNNGFMATSQKELSRLGKEMKVMKTNSELLDEGLVPDPAQ